MTSPVARSNVPDRELHGAWRARSENRRKQPRFEIVGQLRGALTWHEALPIRDVGLGGALVQSPRPLPVGTVHPVRLETEHGLNAVTVRVCHLTPSQPGGEYLVGLQFVDPDQEVVGQVQRIAASGDTEPSS
jgi:hypothetical protein